MGKGIINEVKQEIINIDLLVPSPLNTYESGDIDDLVGNIKSCGLLTPPTVVGPKADGTYEILAGERRFKALSFIHSENPDLFSGVPCYVCGPYDMNTLEKQLIIESSNLETRDFDKNEHRMEVMKILKRMADKGDINQRDIVKEASKYMNCSERYRRMYMQIFNNNNEELNQLINDKKVTVSLASRIAGLEEDKQKEAIDRIKNGEKPKDILDEFACTNKQAVSGEKESTVPHEKSETEDTLSSTDDDKGTKTSTSKSPYGEYGDAFTDDGFNDIIDRDDIDEIDSAFFGGSSNVDAEYDTVGGEYKKIKSDDSTSNSETDEQLARKVIKWAKRMLKKTEFTDVEEEALDAIKEVIDYAGL